ncbi:hypothetical protein PR202_ga16916 [Eleusine coracana subsp. coracana]|uniref:Uncharacterized protein n=1 Tax=Eleusine coracana subsp. coracana TaxID=191504 RepID=A0AAV5CNZ9_ELECO|nr:hypothetical protein PR202_ga16916 [Eleusine coracana subsp. coracana]
MLLWSAIALVFITTAIIKIASARTLFQPRCNKSPLPPLVGGFSLIGLSYTLLMKGVRAMIGEQEKRLGGVFTISILGWKVTFLVGPEVSDHFYQGLDSEISHGNILDFTVPMFGKEVGHGVDIATQNEQIRFCQNALKPSKCRSHIYPMVQEAEVR